MSIFGAWAESRNEKEVIEKYLDQCGYPKGLAEGIHWNLEAFRKRDKPVGEIGGKSISFPIPKPLDQSMVDIITSYRELHKDWQYVTIPAEASTWIRGNPDNEGTFEAVDWKISFNKKGLPISAEPFKLPENKDDELGVCKKYFAKPHGEE